MKSQEFISFLRQNYDKMHQPTIKFLEEQVRELETEPAAFAFGAIKAQLDWGVDNKDFLLGILVGFSLLDERVQFKK